MADNALSSASNFLSSVVALRAGGAEGFAAAGICLVLLRISVAVSRSYAVEPLVTGDPAATTVTVADLRTTLRAATSSGVALAAASGVYLLSFEVGLSAGLVLLMSIGLVSMCQGEAVRSLFLFRKQYAWALWYDGLWVVLFCAGLPWMLRWDEPGSVLAVWALTGTASMLLAAPALRRRLSRAASSTAAECLGVRARLGMASETALDRTSNQLSIAVIASAATPKLATGITGARTVLSPLNPLLFALFNFLLPASANVSRSGRQRLIHRIMIGAPLLVLAAALAAIAVPAGWIESIIGGAWTSARPVFVPVALLFASAMVRQLVLAVARGGSMSAEARGYRYLASLFAFAPCLLALLGSSWVLVSLYAVTVLSLLGALLVGQSLANILKDREATSWSP